MHDVGRSIWRLACSSRKGASEAATVSSKMGVSETEEDELGREIAALRAQAESLLARASMLEAAVKVRREREEPGVCGSNQIWPSYRPRYLLRRAETEDRQKVILNLLLALEDVQLVHIAAERSPLKKSVSFDACALVVPELRLLRAELTAKRDHLALLEGRKKKRWSGKLNEEEIREVANIKAENK